MKQQRDKSNGRACKDGPAFCSSRGEFTLNSAIMLFCVMMILALFISVLGTANSAMKLHSVAADLTRYIELRGEIDASVFAELTRLADVAGVTVERHTIQMPPGESKIQLGASFTVTLETTGHIGIGGMVSIPIPLKSTVTGRGERYWK